MDTKETKSTTLESVRSEDFRNTYANHVQFETSAWDLKIRFGQLDQKLGPSTVVEHTAITLPWPQAKVLAYLMQVNVAVHEQLNGRVPVPPGVIPNEEAIRSGATAFRDADKMTEAILRLHNAFVEMNPEAIGEGFTATKPKTKK